MDCDGRAAASARRAVGANRNAPTAGGLPGAHHSTAAATSASQAAAGISRDGEHRKRNKESNEEAGSDAHAGPQHGHADKSAFFPRNHVQRRHQFSLGSSRPTIHPALIS
jgi:hypothetical protein